MLDLVELQTIAQLVDNMEILAERLEKSYDKNDAEAFNKSKKEVLDTKQKIADFLK
ncbi:MAG: hypothetical protein ACP5OG_00350 [Candidatus Nanoarchaeia archaeon]